MPVVQTWNMIFFMLTKWPVDPGLCFVATVDCLQPNDEIFGEGVFLPVYQSNFVLSAGK